MVLVNSGSNKSWLMGLVVIAALLLAPFILSDFRLSLLGKFLSYAILALGIDLIWGYTGMLSLGHGVFFGLGAYCTAMYLKLEASAGGLPDFMAWSDLMQLPWFWKPFEYGWFALGMAIVLPVSLAALLGYLTFRSRIRGVYFSILPQALALIFVILFIGQQPYTGGTNGMTNFKTIFGFYLTNPSVQLTLYYITVIILAGTYIFCRWLTGSRFGKILVAIRDSENRVRFSGFDPVLFKVFAFAMSAGLAGLAGILFVTQVGIISPAMMGIVPSIEMAIWVAVGGRGTLMGAVIGAVLVNAAKSTFSESFPDVWLYFFGTMFVLVVLFFPNGVMGLFKKMPGRVTAVSIYTNRLMKSFQKI